MSASIGTHQIKEPATADLVVRFTHAVDAFCVADARHRLEVGIGTGTEKITGPDDFGEIMACVPPRSLSGVRSRGASLGAGQENAELVRVNFG